MIRVTAEDLETGERLVSEVDNDYVLICAGDRYLDGVVTYLKSGTVVLTVKRRPLGGGR